VSRGTIWHGIDRQAADRIVEEAIARESEEAVAQEPNMGLPAAPSDAAEDVLLVRGPAEIFVLLDFLPSRPAGLDWLADAGGCVT
jgi:hypothetical protein